MEAKPRPHALRKAPKFLDAKILIAALSAAVTVGFWNLFSGQALAVEAAQAKQPPQPEDDTAAVALPVEEPQTNGLPPVPTLVPLMDLSTAGGVTADQQGLPAQPGSPALLRSVAAPTVAVVQKGKPVVDSPSVTVVGRSRGSNPRPAASSRSSR